MLIDAFRRTPSCGATNPIGRQLNVQPRASVYQLAVRLSKETFRWACFKWLKATCTLSSRTVPSHNSQHEKRDWALLMLGAAGPLKPVPTGLRDAGLTILQAVERLLSLLTRRAGCHESGSSSSREALTSNPLPFSGRK
jgi:hypothetical protein